ncbi:type II secretion system protein L, partial [Vibrio parahaemolyticus EKP-021]
MPAVNLPDGNTWMSWYR